DLIANAPQYHALNRPTSADYPHFAAPSAIPHTMHSIPDSLKTNHHHQCPSQPASPNNVPNSPQTTANDAAPAAYFPLEPHRFPHSPAFSTALPTHKYT